MSCSAFIADNNFLKSGQVQKIIKGDDNPNFSREYIEDDRRSRLFEFPSIFTFDSTNNTIETSLGNFNIPVGSYSIQEINDLLETQDGILWNIFMYFEQDFFGDDLFAFGAQALVGETILESSSAFEVMRMNPSGDITDIGFTGQPVMFYPDTFIDFDLIVESEINLVAIIADIRERIDIQPNAIITLEGHIYGSFDAPDWVHVLEYDKNLIFKKIEEEARYVRLRIKEDPSSVRPKIGMLYIGDTQNLPDERNFANGFEIVHTDLTQDSQTEDNQYFFNERPVKRNFNNVAVATANKNVSAFLKKWYLNNKLTQPFFFFLDPKSVVHEDVREVALFGRFKSPITVRHIQKDFYDIDVRIEEVL